MTDTNELDEKKKERCEKIKHVKKLIDKGYSFAKVKEELNLSSTSVVAYYLDKAEGRFKTRAELVEENEQLRRRVEEARINVYNELLENNTCDQCGWPILLCAAQALKRDSSEEEYRKFII